MTTIYNTRHGQEIWVFVASIALCSFRHIFLRVLQLPRGIFPFFFFLPFFFVSLNGLAEYGREGSWGQDLGELEPHTVLLYEIRGVRIGLFFFFQALGWSCIFQNTICCAYFDAVFLSLRRLSWSRWYHGRTWRFARVAV